MQRVKRYIGNIVAVMSACSTLLIVACTGGSSNMKFDNFFDSVTSLAQSDTTAAFEYIRKAGSSGAVSDDTVNLARSNVYLINNEFEKQIGVLKSVIEEHKDHKQTSFYLDRVAEIAKAYEYLGQFGDAIRYNSYGDSIANIMGSLNYRAHFHSSMGDCAVRKDYELAASYYQQANDFYEQMGDSVSIGELAANDLNLISLYHQYEEYDRCLELCNKVFGLFANDEAMQPVDPDKTLRFSLYAYRCICYGNLGDLYKAQDDYVRCLKYDNAYPIAPLLKTKCLIAMKRYDQALDAYEAMVKSSETIGDTLNFSYVDLLEGMMSCYEGEKEYAKALSFCKRCLVLRRMIFTKNTKSNTDFWEAKFRTSEKESDLRDAERDASRGRVLLIIFAIALLAAVVAIFFIMRYNMAIRKMNKTLAMRINDVVDKNKVSAHTSVSKTPADGDSSSTQDDKDAVDTISETARQNVERFVDILKERKLFCDPDLKRDDLLQQLGIAKRTFNHDFEAVMGMSFIKYLAVVRVEYAAQLIRDYPNYTIEAISVECGVSSRSSFYRLFAEHFGISPTEYRRQLMLLGEDGSKKFGTDR